MVLTGAKLDRAVAEARGWVATYCKDDWVWSDDNGNRKRLVKDYHPSTNWQQCGELIEKFKIDLMYIPYQEWPWLAEDQSADYRCRGKTPQEAVCKAVVAMEGEQ